MTTYYTKQDEAFKEVTFSDGLLISMIVEKHIKDALFNATALINDSIIIRVNDAVSNSNIQEKVKDHLATTNVGELVDNAISNAVRDYDYDGTIDSALDSVDIDELVLELVKEHLDSCSIQVSLR
jgi:hypothetical protein